MESKLVLLHKHWITSSYEKWCPLRQANLAKRNTTHLLVVPLQYMLSSQLQNAFWNGIH